MQKMEKSMWSLLSLSLVIAGLHTPSVLAESADVCNTPEYHACKKKFEAASAFAAQSIGGQVAAGSVMNDAGVATTPSCAAALGFENTQLCASQLAKSRDVTCQKAAKELDAKAIAAATQESQRCQEGQSLAAATSTTPAATPAPSTGEAPAPRPRPDATPAAEEVKPPAEEKGLVAKGNDWLNNNPLIAGLLGAGGGLLAGKMVGGDDSEGDDKYDLPILPNGKVNCAHRDAYNFADCVDTLSTVCLQATLNTNVAQGGKLQKKCQAFEKLYCEKSGVGERITSFKLPNDAVLNYTLIESGEGSPSKFCQTTKAVAFCSNENTEECPSCLQLKVDQSPACSNKTSENYDPSMCLTESSTPQLKKALAECSRVSQMDDPMYSDPKIIARLNAEADEADTIGDATPIVTLPASTVLGATASSNKAAVSRKPAADMSTKVGPSLASLRATAIKNWVANP